MMVANGWQRWMKVDDGGWWSIKWMTVDDSPRSVMTSLGQASAALALGSSFFHASHTRLGQKADGLLIGVMSLIMHQASLSGLPESLKTPELVDLGPSRRSRTGIQIAQA